MTGLEINVPAEDRLINATVFAVRLIAIAAFIWAIKWW